MDTGGTVQTPAGRATVAAAGAVAIPWSPARRKDARSVGPRTRCSRSPARTRTAPAVTTLRDVRTQDRSDAGLIETEVRGTAATGLPNPGGPQQSTGTPGVGRSATPHSHKRVLPVRGLVPLSGQLVLQVLVNPHVPVDSGGTHLGGGADADLTHEAFEPRPPEGVARSCR